MAGAAPGVAPGGGDGLTTAEEQGAFDALAGEIVSLLEEGRRQAARSVNAVLTATYWQVGRQITEFEQSGKGRAGYGERLIARVSQELTARLGRGFSQRNVEQMRLFYMTWQIPQTVSAESGLTELARRFPLSWSHYVRLLSVKTPEARAFYEEEAQHGGWSLRQLDRQIATQFYERTLLSRDKAAMLTGGAAPRAEDAVTAAGLVRDPYVLEFLGLKDEYSETDLEDALVRHLESFLLEMGNEFAFVARQKRIRVGDEWYRIDLMLYHRRLRCLVLLDLKVGKFSHADAGQMNLYVNYAAEHLTLSEENPPVGLVLCSERDAAVARYSLGGMTNQILAAEYRLALPDPALLEAELERTRRALAAGGEDGRP